MKKQELIAEVAQLSGHSQAVVREVLDSATYVTRAAVRTGRDVFLFGIGKLEPRRRGPRKARDLHSGAPVIVPERTVVLFRPSDSLLKAANAAT